MREQNPPPVILATLSRDGRTVAIRCPYCQREHTHGAAGIVDGTNPHRSAHCRDQQPGSAAGYVIHMAEGGPDA